MADNLIRVNEIVDDTVYAKGDTCLLINPFDTYHLFRIYNNWQSDSKSLLNLSNNGQKLYLVFKTKKTEVRIPEFVNGDSEYKVDKSNGEVLFKITKENANSILSMNDNTFYITRVFEYEDDYGKVIYTSGEEVLYTGNWADESEWTGTTLTGTINSLRKQLEAANRQIQTLTQTVNDYALAISSLTNENSALSERVSSLEAENEGMLSELEQYRSAEEFTSVVISDNAAYQYYRNEELVNETGGDGIKKTLDTVAGNNESLTEEQLSAYVNNSSLNNAGNLSSGGSSSIPTYTLKI